MNDQETTAQPRLTQKMIDITQACIVFRRNGPVYWLMLIENKIRGEAGNTSDKNSTDFSVCLMSITSCHWQQSAGHKTAPAKSSSS